VSSKQGDPKVTKGLLELGVDVNTRDNKGQTPLQVALEKGDEQVVQLLLQHGAK
jgi:ankyrin repeat protein